MSFNTAEQLLPTYTKYSPIPTKATQVGALRVSASKKQLRDQLNADVDAFLSQGGQVAEIPAGATGIETLTTGQSVGGWKAYGGAQTVLFADPKVSRTLVPDVVSSIENRKYNDRKLASQVTGRRASQKNTRNKRWIYDDFGEPLRWVWCD